MSKSRLLAMAALVATGALGVGVAQAQETQVSWSITIGMPAPVLPVLPAPVIVRPESDAVTIGSIRKTLPALVS